MGGHIEPALNELETAGDLNHSPMTYSVIPYLVSDSIRPIQLGRSDDGLFIEGSRQESSYQIR